MKWAWPYQRYIYRMLNAMDRSKCGRLMIFLPPRHGKSELVTVRYAAWRLLQNQGLKIIVGSYNQKLANKFSGKIKREFRNGCPVPKGLTLNRADEWETTEGGGVKAVGAGAGVTGFGANLMIIDDPVKSRSEAENKNNRDRIYEWFNDDLHTRLEPNGSIILIQTRWHEDDLAGRLLKDAADGGEKWSVVCLPALAEGDDVLEREEERRYARTVMTKRPC